MLEITWLADAGDKRTSQLFLFIKYVRNYVISWFWAKLDFTASKHSLLFPLKIKCSSLEMPHKNIIWSYSWCTSSSLLAYHYKSQKKLSFWPRPRSLFHFYIHRKFMNGKLAYTLCDQTLILNNIKYIIWIFKLNILSLDEQFCTVLRT